MKKYYKCLVNNYYSWDKNNIYSEDSMDCDDMHSLARYVKDRPHHWELVIDDYEIC